MYMNQLWLDLVNWMWDPTQKLKDLSVEVMGVRPGRILLGVTL